MTSAAVEVQEAAGPGAGPTAAPAAGRHPVLRRLVTRVVTGVVVLWAAATVAFWTLQLVPGSVADILAGDLADPELRQALVAEWGLDRPAFAQYLDFLGRLAQGDLGTSYVQRQPVLDVIGDQLGSTVILTLTAGVVAVALAVLLSTATVGRPRVVRGVLSTAELVLVSVPVFWSGILLLMVFSFGLGLFPVAGGTGAQSLVLPTVGLALPTAGLLSQVLRESMERTVLEPFAITVRARGVRESLVVWRHALKHALLPGMTVAGSLVGGLLGGAVITEQVFGRPGLGQITLLAVTNKDVPVVLGVVLLAAAVYVAVSTLLDVLYAVVDPRLRGAR
ncbi:ABC transporter permease [Promicromonospora sukumoe]|uniref:Peptide/nickel transport system permease protein n=1 Tax=Promicromonospora sukumoe TaxID=88382 RepID=A0A7W3J8Y6_9MICO|nr:ABC transporter permease [Promicromonospora sukumoe]MBA8808477.1 peptide/nickel transport system permease protein [Promicromonospora sukumoe]